MVLYSIHMVKSVHNRMPKDLTFSISHRYLLLYRHITYPIFLCKSQVIHCTVTEQHTYSVFFFQ